MRAGAVRVATAPDFAAAQRQLAELEDRSGGRLGVVGLDSGTGAQVTHRADERFPFCSTFKVFVAAAILQRSASRAALLQQRLKYTKGDLVANSPITQQHVEEGMSVHELCAATLQYSDNTAANQLLKILGGPAALTTFARGIGDHEFRLDRWETELNSAIPGDPRDTTTPAAMAASLRRLLLGEVLAQVARAQLVQWMRGNTTGATRVRAGVPSAWIVADKTGTGAYGTTNDVAVAWPGGDAGVGRRPLIVVVFFTQKEPQAAVRNDIVSSAARVVAGAIGTTGG